VADQPSATILVVEDDADVHAAVVETLESSGYRVLSARDGPEALELLDNDPSIDLMFSDLVMPHGMSGLEVAEAAHRRRPDLRVVLTSGYSTEALGGELDFPLIKKPYRLAELVRRIAEALRRDPA
jgi:CheY-like chemotaxis protein